VLSHPGFVDHELLESLAVGFKHRRFSASCKVGDVFKPDEFGFRNQGVDQGFSPLG